jgi:alcohol dehydrogenase (NADP+)
MPSKTRAYGGVDKVSPLREMSIDRRDVGPRDVQFEILFCGVCHSDLHTVKGEWGGTAYPCVPGHEIVGRVTKIGGEVSSFKIGDLAAVGCMVDSCKTCNSCREGLQQYCDNGATVWTYNAPDPHFSGKRTYGGYSTQIVVDERFCLHVPKKLNLAATAPLLCAGITLYSPLRHWGASPGKKVGIVGLGGLGHMGVKLSHAFGAETGLFTTSPGKAEDAKRLGADHVILSKNPDEMNKHAGSFDLIVNTVSASHDLGAYVNLLKRDGTMVLVGVPEHPHPPTHPISLIAKRRSIAGSNIGGIAQTQEMLDFCAEKNIASDIEIIPIQQIEQAYDRLRIGDVKYRFVIDMASLKA